MLSGRGSGGFLYGEEPFFLGSVQKLSRVRVQFACGQRLAQQDLNRREPAQYIRQGGKEEVRNRSIGRRKRGE